MTRLLGFAVLACLMCLIFVSLVARAIDVEVQDRVIFPTREGELLDCNRVIGPHGAVFYTHCVDVP